MKRSTLILGALIALASPIVSAESIGPAPAPPTKELLTVQGTYSISAHKLVNGHGVFVGCVVMAGGNVPTLRNWGDPSCKKAPDATTEHRWNIYKVRSGHVIKSPVNGACLIHSGMAARPELHQWQHSGDKTFCGWEDSYDLRGNGHAYWYLDVYEFGTADTLVGFAGDMVLPYLQRGLAIDHNGQLTFSDQPGDWTFNFNTLAP